MRGATSFALATALAATTTAPAHAQDTPRVYTGSSAWAMNYAEDSCQLSRDFSHEDETITLALERFQPGDSLHITLVSDALARFNRQYTTRFQLAPGSAQFESRHADAKLEDGRDYYNIGPVSLRAATFEEGDAARLPELAAQMYRPADELELARTLGPLSFTAGFTRDFALDLGPMAPPIKAMQQCMDELLTHWGVDVERHRSMTRPALPAEDPQGWVTTADYPAEERRRRWTGNNAVRLMLDATGRPTSCHVQRQSGADGFNETACRILMEKGRFHPALDAAGEPMPSYYVVNFRFQLFSAPAGSASALR